jgi:O-methyltransferase domain
MPELPDANDDRLALDLLVRGFQISRMLRLVADFGVADRIPPADSVAIDALATECGVQSQPLLRVLRALAAFGVFTVAADGRITHSARSRLLRTDTPNSMYHSARFWAAPGSWAAWGKLDVAMTGGVPHVAAWNMTRFEYLRVHPDEARSFDAMMANFPDKRHPAVAAAYDFSGAKLIADIGGGNGAALRHILPRFPAVRGLLFDRDDVVNAVQTADLLDGRIETAGGSFFNNVPRGADIYMLIRVLHDWPDDDCRRILRSCRTAMGSDAVLLIGDQILEPEPARGRPTGYLVDAQMMAMFGSARERTSDEFANLLSESGFTLRRFIPTQSSVWIIEALPK